LFSIITRTQQKALNSQLRQQAGSLFVRAFWSRATPETIRGTQGINALCLAYANASARCIRFSMLTATPSACCSLENLMHSADSLGLRRDKLKLSTLTATLSLAVRGQFGFCVRVKMRTALSGRQLLKIKLVCVKK